MPLKRNWLVCAFLLPLVVCSGLADAFEAGAAKVEITPPLGSPMNGYGDRLGRGAVEVHDPVWARALYLSDGETAVFLVTADLCMISRELRDRVLELAPREAPRENIILAATHTHSAQGGMIRSLPFRAVSGRFAPEILEQTARGFAEAMHEAYRERVRAAIGYGTAKQEVLSTNRRHEGGPIDPQIGVIRVDDADGDPIAILGNFAAHPTTVGDDDAYAISADYPGFFYTELESLAAEGCVASFVNGAEGNQRCANPESKPGWERTESIGRLLAGRVKEIANGIRCSDAKLHVGYAAPQLPPTMAADLFPASTVLQTLEINDLLLAFVPGEPCVEIGLAMRQRALARGYAAHFTVGLANDYLAYFIPVTCYSHFEYENSANFYGPRMLDWFCREFSKLMTRGEPETGRPPAEAPKMDRVGEVPRVVLEGDAYALGYQRGLGFRDAILAKYETAIVAPIGRGDLLPKTGFWKTASPYLNTTLLGLPALSIGSRPLLAGVSAQVFEEIEGVADAVGLPFDAVWLVQCIPTFGTRDALDAFYRTAMCTVFAAVGDKAGADDLVVGRNLDWPGDEQPIVADVRPAAGHRFIQIGFPWNVGAFTGMNDAGLVLCAERVAMLGNPASEGAPIEFVLRDLLQTCGSLDEAVAELQTRENLRGYHVLAAAPSGALGALEPVQGGSGAAACVLEFGATVELRRQTEGLLLGADPGSDRVDEAAKARYARVAELLAEEHIIAPAEIRETLVDADPLQAGNARIWNEDTKYGVVFEPGARRFHVSFPDASGAPGEYVTISMKGGAS